MNDTVFDLFKGALFGSIVSIALFTSYASYVNTNEILNLLKGTTAVEETLEQKITRYKQFDAPQISNCLFRDPRHTITGVML